jgi:hypothetical protein
MMNAHTLLAALLVVGLGAAASSAEAVPLRFTIERPTTKGRFVQLEIDLAAKTPMLRGCQTGAKAKRCTRRRVRVPLTAAQLRTVRRLWSLGASKRCAAKRRARRRRRSEGQLWASGGAGSADAILPPRHDHVSLRPSCRALARLGWYLLRRYDRLPLAPPVRPASKDRACQRDADCAIAWRPCGYHHPPCVNTWKRAVNRAANQRHRRRWAKKRPVCRPFPCPGPKARWLGKRARCVAKQCVVR